MYLVNKNHPEKKTETMRILLDQSAHDMRNKGNNALLETAMQRLRTFWPDASLEVITDVPGLLKMHYPDTFAINPNDLSRTYGRFERYKRFLPNSLWWLLFELREEIRHRQYWKANASELVTHTSVEKDGESSRLPLQTPSQKKRLQEVISQFDLFVASGGGYMTDTDKPMLWSVFDRLEAAITCGVPTAMVGQGIGPIKDPELLARAREILPSVGLILYRNRRNGFPLLESLGVLPERIALTGDDAVEMTYDERLDKLGHGVGVSLRVAHYTQVDSEHIGAIRRALHTVAGKYNAPLVAVPISGYYEESDSTHINKLLDGYDLKSTGWRKFETPLDAIRRTRECRVMVTGTYHGAIFALAQGIPVVGIARSDEYFDKLSELADEFPDGINVLRLNSDFFSDRLITAIDTAWNTAEELRDPLLQAAVRQIEWGKAGYQRLCDLVEQEK